MFVVLIIRYILGYVRFSAAGGFPERFINLSTRNNINIWGGYKQAEVFTGYTVAKNYKRLRTIARKSGVRLRIIKKTGLPFVLKKHKKRTGFLIGLLFFFLVLWFLSLFVWSVDLVSEEGIDNREVLAKLAELGLKPGSYKPRLNLRMIKEKALIDIPSLSWLAVRIEGSRAIVEVERRENPPDLIPTEGACNIKASKDGYILKIEVYEGQGVVKKGDSVVKGDLLVSGLVEDKLGETNFCHARALIIARTTPQIRIKYNRAQQRRVATEKIRKNRTIFFFGIGIPLYIGNPKWEDTDTKINESFLKIGKTTLPFSFREEVITKMETISVKLDDKQLAEEGRQRLEEIEREELSKAKLLAKDVELKHEPDHLMITANYVCEEDIGELSPIILEKEPVKKE